MRKKKILPILLLIITTFIFNINIAKAETTTLSVGEYIKYGETPSGGDYRTGLYSTSGYSDNAYCIMPGINGVTGTFNSISVDSSEFKNKAISNMRLKDSSFTYNENQYKVYILLLKYALYHGPGSPGYENEPSTANDRYYNLIETACNQIYPNGCETDKQRYAVNHVMLSYIMSQYFGWSNISDDSEWNANIKWATSVAGGTTQICGGIGALYGSIFNGPGTLDDRIANYSSVFNSDPNFGAYIIQTNNSSTQDYIYYTYTVDTPEPEYGGIIFRKTFSEEGTYSDRSKYHFRYGVTGPNGEDLGDVYTDNDGYVTYPTDGSLTLEVGDSYTFCEYFGDGGVDDGKASVYNNNHERIGFSDYVPEYSCRSYRVVKNPSGNSYSYENIRQAKYCTKVSKLDSKTESAVSGATFKLYTNSSCTTGEVSGSTSGNTTTFNDLEDIDYWVKETVTPSGYASPSSNCKKVTSIVEQGSDGSCSANATSVSNAPYYISFYKVDENGNPLTSATFRVKNSSGSYITATDKNSSYNNCYVYTGTTSSESAAKVMKPNSDGRVCVVKVPNGTYSAHEISTGNDGYYFNDGVINNIKTNTDVEGDSSKTLKNRPYVLNFYKETETGLKADGAKFEILNGSTKIGYSGTENYTDNNGVTKKCYIYSAGGTTTYISGANGAKGEVCIVRIPKGINYTIKEIEPVDYHTFGTKQSISLTPDKNYAVKSTSNTFINFPTEFEFTKNVGRTKEKGLSVEGSETITVNGETVTLDELTLRELQNISFSITTTGSTNKLMFVKKSDGIYEYAGNSIDGLTGASTANLTVGSNKKIKVLHLPVGTYNIVENNGGTCESEIDYSKCIGYYDQSVSQTFQITNCSSDNATSCTNHSKVTATMTNIPTEITFTKSDLYSYEDASDTVKFENAEELRAFDDIVFKIFTYDENGNKKYLTLKKIGNSGVCTSEDSYSIYRYVAGDESDGASGTELHTCGGHIVITNLCRGKKYYIEEVSVPENSVFTLPEREEDRIREYSIPCTDDEAETSQTTTAIINDTPTRVIFQKRDSKYGYLIPDETTTFKVYRCKKNTKCHPSENDSNAVLVKFTSRGVIRGDREDSNKEVYKFLSTSDEESGQRGVTDLHPYRGELILRYLPGGFNYVLLETVSPKNYTLPKGRNAETEFTVSTSTVDVDEIDVPNKPTSLLLKKYADDGELLEGAEFRIYEGTTCDSNLSAYAQPKELLSLKTISDGIYEYRPNADTNVVRTCTDTVDGKCSGMTSTLTYETYLDTWANFENSLNQREEEVEIKAGEALIQYLEYGHCYIIEEVKAPKGYSLPEKIEDRFIMVRIEAENDVVDTYKELINKPTPYTFYKFDEHNELIDGAEFKLQKLNKDKIYEDVTVTKEKDGNDRTFYKVDSNSTNKVITTKNGIATIYYLEEGQYRIVETKAPTGKELPAKQLNVATFFVDKDGVVTGSSIITNKPKTEKIEVKPKAEAELIVNISTGQQVIRYGLIISVIVLSIFGLILVQRKSKKDK